MCMIINKLCADSVGFVESKVPLLNFQFSIVNRQLLPGGTPLNSTGPCIPEAVPCMLPAGGKEKTEIWACGLDSTYTTSQRVKCFGKMFRLILAALLGSSTLRTVGVCYAI